MKKMFTFIIFVILTTTSAIAFANLPTNTKATRENLLEDAVIDLLRPQIGKVIENHYGTTFEIGTFCERIINIKSWTIQGLGFFKLSWNLQHLQELITL